MSKHHPAHAKSGLGRYTAPRRQHPAHAAPSADGVRIARVAGTIIGGGALASAGLLGLIGTPAGASATLGPESSPPFSSLGTTFTDGSGNTATLAGGGGAGASAEAEAGELGAPGTAVGNTAYSDSFGVGTFAGSIAGDGGDADVSNNLASSTALGVAGVATTEAGFGTDADASNDSAIAWTFSGASDAQSAVATDARAIDDIAWAGSQAGGDAISTAADVTHGNASGDRAYAWSVGAIASATAGLGTGNETDDLAVANGPFGLAEASVLQANHSSASAGAAGGEAIVTITAATGSSGAATAAGLGADADVSVEGSGDTASASSIGTGAETESVVEGTGQSADSAADGSGSIASAAQVPGTSSVLATTGLGGAAFASNSGGIWTVSLNGATLVG